jgi:hypothetical protein
MSPIWLDSLRFRGIAGTLQSEVSVRASLEVIEVVEASGEVIFGSCASVDMMSDGSAEEFCVSAGL